jgi:hypothetical protein
MNLIHKDKAQLIAMLQKHPTIHIIDIREGKPISLAEKIRSSKDPNATAILLNPNNYYLSKY